MVVRYGMQPELCAKNQPTMATMRSFSVAIRVRPGMPTLIHCTQLQRCAQLSVTSHLQALLTLESLLKPQRETTRRGRSKSFNLQAGVHCSARVCEACTDRQQDALAPALVRWALCPKALCQRALATPPPGL